jgi:hypothetical protein
MGTKFYAKVDEEKAWLEVEPSERIKGGVFIALGFDRGRGGAHMKADEARKLIAALIEIVDAER